MIRIAVAALVFAALTFVLRLAAFVGFSNDHYVHLTRGVQMLAGDWPVRDFVDPGLPLMYVVSAVGQLVGGRTLLPEVMIVSAAFAAAAGLTLWLVSQWTGSIALGAWAAIVQVVIFPRSYSYPKVLLYVVAAAAFATYAARPSRGRIVGLAALAVVAFLFRHDHGLYIGAASIPVIAIAAGATGRREAARAVLLFCIGAGAMAAPFFLYLQANGGIVPYFVSALEFSRSEAAITRLRSWPVPPVDTLASAELLFYAFWAIPAISASVLAWRWRALDRRDRALAAGVIVLGVCVAAGFLRDSLQARVPDAIVPSALLLAWMASQTFKSPVRVPVLRRGIQVSAAIAACWLALAAGRAGNLSEQLDRAGALKGLSGVRERVRTVFAELRDPYAERQMPSHLAIALVPFYSYVQSCTEPSAKLFVPGFAPEVAYYAQRDFAGGQVTLFGEFYSSEAEQRLIVSRLENDRAPMVVLPPGAGAGLDGGFPIVSAFVRANYRAAFEVPVRGHEEPAAVLVRRDLQASLTSEADGWPCFR